MLTIINREREAGGSHGLQAQSGRTECWLEGWVAVPEELETAVWECGGYCDLDIQGGVLVGLTPKERPAPEEPEGPQSDIAALAAAYREGVDRA